MMISKKMQDALNTQVGNEFGAFFQYLAIAAWFDRENLSVLSGHFFRQADEEREHALKIAKYVMETGAKVKFPATEAPKSDFKSAEEAVELSLTWEQTVTKQINGLVDLAIKENDHLTRNFLAWFVDEQLEEVSSMEKLLGLVQRAGEKNLLFVEGILARQSAS